MLRLPGASTGTPAGAPGDSSQVGGKGAAGLFPVHNIIESLSSKHFGEQPVRLHRRCLRGRSRIQRESETALDRHGHRATWSCMGSREGRNQDRRIPWISRTEFRYDAFCVGMLCFGDNIERKFVETSAV